MTVQLSPLINKMNNTHRLQTTAWQPQACATGAAQPYKVHAVRHRQSLRCSGHAGKVKLEKSGTPNFTEKAWFREHVSSQESIIKPATCFRFWHDEKLFKGTGETSLAQQALLAAGGRRTGGNVKAAATVGPLGWERKTKWDALWSPARTARQALQAGLLPGQLCNAVPGTQSICKKKDLAETLRQAYGEAAFDIVPRTYSVPRQVKAWREWMQANRGQKEGQLWMLKTAQHLGKGLKLVPRQLAVKEMLRQYERAQLAKKEGRSKEVRPFVVAQQYIEDPLLINGRKFGIRVWAVITSYEPLRVYLHTRGLVLFSSDEYEGETLTNEEGNISGAHVTNYAQNKDSDVWSLEQLQQHLGAEAYNKLFTQIMRSTAFTYAAALGHMRGEAARLAVPPSSTFELMGLDFLIDSSLKPWLLEVNSTPSLAVEHSDPAAERMIYDQKNTMVVDMFKLVQVPGRFLDNTEGLPPLSRPARTAGNSNISATVRTAEIAEPATAAGAAAAGGSVSKRTSGGALGTNGDNEGACSTEATTMARREQQAAVRLAVMGQVANSPLAANEQVLAALVESELELRCRSGFLPLLAQMPWEAEAEGWSIPWSEYDMALQAWCCQRPGSHPTP